MNAERGGSTPGRAPGGSARGDGFDASGLRPLRVLQLIDGLGVGGAEELVTRFAEATRDGPVATTVATLRSHPGSPLEARLAAAGTPATVFPLTAWPDARLRIHPSALARLVRFVRLGGFDVIHTHLNTADAVGGVVGRACRVPVVSTQHNVRTGGPRRFRNAVRRTILRHATAELVAVGPTVAAVLRSDLPGARISVVPNPAPELPPPTPASRARTRLALQIPATAPVLIAVGRLAPQKNHALMLDAMRLITAERPDATLVVAGEGRLAADLQRRARDLDLGHRVRFLGRRDDVGELLGASDLFVSSSDWEGMPLSMLEALAAGLSVVTTDVGDCREVVGPAGVVVPPGDPGRWAEAVLTLLEPGARAARAEAARHRARDEYSTERWVGRLVEVYERLASSRRPLVDAHRGERPCAA